ncbi:MAG TPA: lysophospholipase [Burkholderiaceae bacterium]|nr:lysophospholipase [Burkholderiaceae bacterium]
MIRGKCSVVISTGLLIVGLKASAIASTIGGPLNLADEGMFFVNGQAIVSKYPGVSPTGAVKPGTVVVNQMYVHYRIPAKRTSNTPIVLVHGGGLTGVSYETTPDGREGWATYLVRKGLSVYVVDTPGRGRSGFNATAINQAKAESDVAVLPGSVLMVTSELAWTLFRFGPTYGTPHPNAQFPTEAIASLGAQVVPFSEVMLDKGAMGAAPQALAALLDKVGPAVVVVHSLAGPFADALVELCPRLVKAVVNIEGAQSITPSDAQIAAYQGIPVLELFGDHLDSPVFTARPRYEARKAVVERINKHEGGRATLVRLPDVGIHGNSHMLMQDKNNLTVADFVFDWIAKNVK